MIKIAFCDDDLSVLEDLCALLVQYREKHDPEIGYAAFRSPLEFMAAMEKGACFDVLFLDIIMPGQNGIDAAKEIRQLDQNIKIIFLSSSSEFALESYTVSAYFYQIKPVLQEEFTALLDSIVSECEKERQCSLVLRCKSGITRIALEKLEYCEVIGRTLLFHMKNGEILESMGSMNKLCNELMQYGNFLRPHRSFLVNMEYIKSISYKAITMEHLAEIPIPHGKFAEMKEKYLGYIFNRRQVFRL